MNYVKNRYFVLVLFYSSLLNSFDLTENQQIALQNIGFNGFIAGAIGLTSYVAWTCSIPEDFYVKKSHPYAQLWYDEMAAKYVQLQLDQKRFLSARRGLLNNKVSWESAYYDTYAPAEDLEKINDIYKKQQQNIDITLDERLFLLACEFCLLHEIAHVHHNDSRNLIIFSCVLAPATELLTAAYRSTGLYNPVVNVDIFGTENRLDKVSSILTCVLGWLAYIRYTESKADEFACKHAASVDVLQAAQQLFKSFDEIALAAQDETSEDYELALYIIDRPALRWVIDFLSDHEHPGLSVRAQSIQNQIERRLLESNQ